MIEVKKMKVSELKRFDMADHLDSEEAIADYINIVLEENDPAALTEALGTVARARNMSQLARDTGMSREGLYKALSGEGNPSFATVMKVAQALGVRFHAATV